MAEVPCLFRFVLVREIQQDFVGVFNKTIIPLTLLGYEMIIANSALRASLAIYHLVFNMSSWNNYLIITVQKLQFNVQMYIIHLMSVPKGNMS